jgi:hypothetical protein
VFNVAQVCAAKSACAEGMAPILAALPHIFMLLCEKIRCGVAPSLATEPGEVTHAASKVPPSSSMIFNSVISIYLMKLLQNASHTTCQLMGQVVFELRLGHLPKN